MDVITEASSLRTVRSEMCGVIPDNLKSDKNVGFFFLSKQAHQDKIRITETPQRLPRVR